jgi:hypothetical protein
MDYGVLPGPPLAELARTAVARARTVAVTCDGQPWAPSPRARLRAGPAGQLILATAPGPLPDHPVTAGARVTAVAGAAAPFTALALSGVVESAARRPDGSLTHRVTVLAVEFTGPAGSPVPLARYLAAAPDPLWRQAPAILGHLERGHRAQLLACVRAHGLREALWVMPRAVDRFGLELGVLTTTGVGSVRLPYPDGPVRCFSEIPPPVRTLLSCRCLTLPGWAAR